MTVNRSFTLLKALESFYYSFTSKKENRTIRKSSSNRMNISEYLSKL